MPDAAQPDHPLGTRARFLLTSVFGPYARDDEYGSRKINPMELYQNPVTRVQGGFSLRMYRPSGRAALLISSVGCPVGCNFCSTSALFGGKGRLVNFFETGDDLFAVMCETEKKHKTRSFFVPDEKYAPTKNLTERSILLY